MNQLYNVSFSPTETSLKVAEQIAKAFDGEKVAVDLCREPDKDIQVKQEDIGIFSAPCYGGRIPETAVERLSHVHGEDTPAIVCVTFGNRAFEDALLELADCAEANGFQVIAGCAVATEHNIMHIFGQGRPDVLDKEEIHRFSLESAQKIKDGKRNRPTLPGNYPYKGRHSAKMPILVDKKTCTSCGLCAQKCPVKAISEDGRQVDEKICINCMRCIQICPNKSRSIPEELVTALVERLRAACQERKANGFYL
nr:EFR1 family ferrodoxin [uncultured Solibaculum sp.]